MISDGSELLLLVPQWAGLIGSMVLPFLGAVPDSAIGMFIDFFSEGLMNSCLFWFGRYRKC